MAPKKDKGKQKVSGPPKMGLTDVRTWLTAVAPNKPVTINEPKSMSQSSTGATSRVPATPKESSSSLDPDNYDTQAIFNAIQLLVERKQPIPAPSATDTPQPSKALVQIKQEASKPAKTVVNKQQVSGAITRSKASSQNFQLTEVSSGTQNVFPKGPKSPFFIKDRIQNIVVCEPDMVESDPHELAKLMFSNDFHYIPHDVFKTVDYYEKILTETHSVSFRKFKNNNMLSYSTCRIHKVINLGEWCELHGQPWTTIKFNLSVTSAQPPHRPTYNYYDYTQAWWNIFYRQNEQRSHSWLIYFDKCHSKLPHWFSRWWDDFGAISEIVHPNARKGFQSFLNFYVPTAHEKYFNKEMLYFQHIGISWVMLWFYDFSTQPNKPVALARRFKIKWWDNFRFWEKTDEASIIKWINENSARTRNITAYQQGTPFLHDRGFLLSNLAQAKDPEEMQNLLELALAQLKGSSTEAADSSSSAGGDNDNDCYDLINLAEP